MLHHLFALMLLPAAALANPSPADSDTLRQALQHLPENTSLIVALPNIETLTTGLARFGKDAGIDELADVTTTRLLEELLDEHTLGIDPRGPAVLAVTPSMQPMLVVRIKDETAWLRDLDLDEQTPDAAGFMIHGEKCFALRAGQFGLLGQSAAVLEGAREPAKARLELLPPAVHTLLEKNHAVLWADVPSWRPLAGPFLAVAEGFFHMGLAQAGPQGQGAADIWRWLFEKTRVLLDESQAYAAFVEFTPEGIRAGDMLTVAPGGRVADYLEKVKSTKRDLFRGLPDRRAAVYFAVDWFLPPDAPTLSEDMLSAMMQSALGRTLAEDAEAMESMDASRKLQRLVQRYNGGVDFGIDGGGMAAWGNYLTFDKDEVLGLLRKSIRMIANAKMMSLYGSDVTTELAHETQTVRGTQTDVYTFSIRSRDEQLQKVFRSVYGEQTAYCVAPGPAGVLFTMAPGAGGTQLAAQMLAPDATPLSAARDTKQALERIAPDPHLCLLVDLPRLVEGALDWIRTIETDVPLFTPPDTRPPYFVGGLYLEPNRMRTEMFLPADAVRILVDGWKTPPPPEPAKVE